MIYLAIWLIALGVSDLLRARRDRVGTRQVILVAVVAVNVLFGLLLAIAPTALIATWVTTVVGVGLVVYIVASAAALNHQGQRGETLERRVALAALVGSVLLLLATSGRVTADGGLLLRWYDGLAVPTLAQLPMETFLLGLGLFVVQLSSANIVVRMVLDGAGTPAEANEETVRVGRLLGPMERVLILGLGMAGYLTAAAIVIAAVGLLRYQASPGEAGPRRAEPAGYFLVGSFVSWLIALAGLPLL